MAEGAKASGQPVDPLELSGWIQRGVCLAGNVNSSLTVKKRKAILFKIDPKMSNLAVTESGAEAGGLLFGKYFAKEMGQFADTFIAIEKALAPMRKVFTPWFLVGLTGQGVACPATTRLLQQAHKVAPLCLSQPTKVLGMLRVSFPRGIVHGAPGLPEAHNIPDVLTVGLPSSRNSPPQ